PEALREEEGLLGLGEALRALHAPTSQELVDRARERIGFEELFLLQLAAQRARRRRLSGEGVIVPYDPEVARAFAASLPFQLTDGQRRAAHAILLDMSQPG